MKSIYERKTHLKHLKILSKLSILFLMMFLYIGCSGEMLTSLFVSKEKLEIPVLEEEITPRNNGIYEFNFKVKYRGTYAILMMFNQNKDGPLKKDQLSNINESISLKIHISLQKEDEIIHQENISFEKGHFGKSLLIFKSPRNIPLKKNIKCTIQIIEMHKNFSTWFESIDLRIERMSSFLR